MSCNAKKDPNGTWRIQYRWTDWTGTKKKSQKEINSIRNDVNYNIANLILFVCFQGDWIRLLEL